MPPRAESRVQRASRAGAGRKLPRLGPHAAGGCEQAAGHAAAGALTGASRAPPAPPAPNRRHAPAPAREGANRLRPRQPQPPRSASARPAHGRDAGGEAGRAGVESGERTLEPDVGWLGKFCC